MLRWGRGRETQWSQDGCVKEAPSFSSKLQARVSQDIKKNPNEIKGKKKRPVQNNLISRFTFYINKIKNVN